VGFNLALGQTSRDGQTSRESTINLQPTINQQSLSSSSLGPDHHQQDQVCIQSLGAAIMGYVELPDLPPSAGGKLHGEIVLDGPELRATVDLLKEALAELTQGMANGFSSHAAAAPSGPSPAASTAVAPAAAAAAPRPPAIAQPQPV
jgi:hypothetical protein